MSFAKDVKNEITTITASDESLKGELYGFLKLKGEVMISSNEIDFIFKTNSISITRRIITILKKFYIMDSEIKSKKRSNLDYKNIYYISLGKNAKKILMDLKIMDEEYNYIEKINSTFPAYAIIRGMFLATGSINDPKTSLYHLEVTCNTEEEKNFLISSLKDLFIDAKSTIRKNKYVVYIKKAEQIGDFLKLIGSVSTMFDFENERIKRDLNNMVNRITNCDLANSDKTQKTALKQLEQIELIEKYLGFESLTTRLMEAVTLRVNNPDFTLQELSDVSEEQVGHFISKSGINHCFRDLENLVKTVKK